MNMREDLKAFVDNELPEERRTEILRAIESDPELQAEVIELRQISRVIREEAWQPEPVGLEKTLAALEAKKNHLPWWLAPQAGWALGTACVIALVVFVVPKLGSHEDVAADMVAAGSTEFKAPAKGIDQGQVNGEPQATRAPLSDGDLNLRAGNAQAQASLPSAEKQRNRGGAGKGAEHFYSRPETPAYSPKVESGITVSPSTNTFVDVRSIVKTATLSVEVDEVAKAQQQAESIAKSVGGRVESSSKNADEGSLATAELTLRVPVNTFETAVNRIRSMGRVTTDSITGEDVTTQVVDTEARLKVLRAEEDQYVTLLKATKKIGEVLSVKERLSQVRQEIESLDATRKALRAQSAESTINLSLTEKPTPEKPKRDENWLEAIWAKAVSGLSSVGRGLGAAVVYIFVYAPVWLPILFLGWLLARRTRR